MRVEYAPKLYLLSMLTCSFNITIDRLIHSLAHGKDEVDGLNAVTKRYVAYYSSQKVLHLYLIMCTIIRFLLQCMYNVATTRDDDIDDKFQPWVYSNHEKTAFPVKLLGCAIKRTGRMGYYQLRRIEKGNKTSQLHKELTWL